MHQSFSKISIVTPSFNQAVFIEEALASVKEQNYPNMEHIVVDGASTDGTLDILRGKQGQPGWGHLHWISEPDRGQSDALNKGFRWARGSIIGWLNSDDRYRPGCFATIAQEFAAHKEADVIYGDYAWMDETGRVKRIRREIEFSRFILSYHRVLYIPTTSTFFRGRIFEEGNWLDRELHYVMDYELFLRLAKKGYCFHHVSSVLADFRWHAQSKSSAYTEKQLEEHDAIAMKYSRALQRLRGTLNRRLGLAAFRAAAASLRYLEKVLRGYYFEQFWPRQASAPTVVLHKEQRS